jgi:hypothetical protein
MTVGEVIAACNAAIVAMSDASEWVPSNHPLVARIEAARMGLVKLRDETEKKKARGK